MSMSTLNTTRTHRWWAIALSCVVILAMVGGVFLICEGLKKTPVESMPLPTQTYSVSPEEAIESAQAQDGGDTGFSVDDMTGPSIWIPALDAYAPIVAQTAFEESKYSGFQTLAIPSNPQTAAWYADGGPLAGGTDGTTLVAAHVATAANRGVFWGIENVSAGSVIWTKNEEGTLQEWAVTHMWFAEHQAFPQEYFASTGERRLVVTTCGGSVNDQGYYEQNIFLIATPVL